MLAAQIAVGSAVVRGVGNPHRFTSKQQFYYAEDYLLRYFIFSHLLNILHYRYYQVGCFMANRVIIKNKKRKIHPLIVGKNTNTAVTVNIGISSPQVDDEIEELEYKKAQVAIESGADILSDLSISGNIKKFRKKLLKDVKIPIGTCPMYETCITSLNETGAIINSTEDDFLDSIKEQSREGVDVMTIHAAMTSKILDKLKDSRRLIPISSRGGAWLAGYMIKNKKENPFYSRYDEILEIVKKYEVTLCIGSSLRPGSIIDGLDELFLNELVVQSQLVHRALEKGVKIIIDGVGHVPADQIPVWVNLAKKMCHNVPIRPLVLATDIGVGYDHVSGAISGAIAAINGADILCCMTRTEHIGSPRLEDIREATISYKIAAHIADIVKLNNVEADIQISKARVLRDWDKIWKYAIDGKKALKIYNEINPDDGNKKYCTMCGELCSYNIIDKYME